MNNFRRPPKVSRADSGDESEDEKPKKKGRGLETAEFSRVVNLNFSDVLQKTPGIRTMMPEETETESQRRRIRESSRILLTTKQLPINRDGEDKLLKKRMRKRRIQ